MMQSSMIGARGKSGAKRRRCRRRLRSWRTVVSTIGAPGIMIGLVSSILLTLSVSRCLPKGRMAGPAAGPVTVAAGGWFGQRDERTVVFRDDFERDQFEET